MNRILKFNIFILMIFFNFQLSLSKTYSIGVSKVRLSIIWSVIFWLVWWKKFRINTLNCISIKWLRIEFYFNIFHYANIFLKFLNLCTFSIFNIPCTNSATTPEINKSVLKAASSSDHGIVSFDIKTFFRVSASPSFTVIHKRLFS